MVLFITSLNHVDFLKRLLQQSHDSLSSLQVLFFKDSRQDHEHTIFWSSLCHVQFLRHLQLVISATHADPIEEVGPWLYSARLRIWKSDVVSIGAACQPGRNCSGFYKYHLRSFVLQICCLLESAPASQSMCLGAMTEVALFIDSMNSATIHRQHI